MATETTATSAAAWRPDIRYIHAADAVPDALVLLTSTIAGSVEGDAPAVRVPYVDDATAAFVAEGGEIAESNPGLAEVIVYTGKVAQLIRLSREQLHQPDAETLLSTSVQRAVTKKANEAYIAQAAPTSPAVTPPAGLLNITGIVNGGAIADDLDVLVDALATIEGNGGTPSHILAAPDAWARLNRFKVGTDRNDSLLGAGTTAAARYLLSLPVLTTPAMPTGNLLVLDQTAIVSAVGDVQVAFSEDAYFAHDSVGLRCTWRFGQNVVKPNRIAKLTVTAPA